MVRLATFGIMTLVSLPVIASVQAAYLVGRPVLALVDLIEDLRVAQYV